MSAQLAHLFVNEARALMRAGMIPEALRSIDNALACRNIGHLFRRDMIALKARLAQENPYWADRHQRLQNVIAAQEYSLVKYAKAGRRA